MFPFLLKLLFFSNFNVNGTVNRRFFINDGYYGCGKDSGWVVVIDGPGPCPMDTRKTSTTVHYVKTRSHSLMPGGKLRKIKIHLGYKYA